MMTQPETFQFPPDSLYRSYQDDTLLSEYCWNGDEHEGGWNCLQCNLDIDVREGLLTVQERTNIIEGKQVYQFDETVN